MMEFLDCFYDRKKIILFLSIILCSIACNVNNTSNKKKELPIIQQKKKVELTNHRIDSLLRISKLQEFVLAKNSIFKNIQFDKVIAYECLGEAIDDKNLILNSNNKKLARVLYKQKEMTKQEVEKLSRLLSDTNNYNGKQSACFNPHLGFVFFKNNKIVCQLLICIICNNFKCSKNLHLFQESFSEKGTQELIQFTKELDLFAL
jgi:hypothetical protein